MTLQQIINKADYLLIILDCGQGTELSEAKLDYTALKKYYFNTYKPNREQFFQIFGFAVWEFYEN